MDSLLFREFDGISTELERAQIAVTANRNVAPEVFGIGSLLFLRLGLGIVIAQVAAAALYAAASWRGRVRPRGRARRSHRPAAGRAPAVGADDALGVVPLTTTAIAARLGPVALGGQQIAIRVGPAGAAARRLAVPAQV